MAQTIAVPSDLQEFGGLKVALVSALADTIDSVESKRKLVEDQFFSGTRTAANNYDLTGFAGTSLLQIGLNITAHSGNTIFLVIQKLLPDGVIFTDVARWDVTTTAHKYINVNAAATGSVLTRGNLVVSSGVVIDGPWGDTLRLQIYCADWTATSITFTADILAL